MEILLIVVAAKHAATTIPDVSLVLTRQLSLLYAHGQRRISRAETKSQSLQTLERHSKAVP
jgi:hypothetical protein